MFTEPETSESFPWLQDDSSSSSDLQLLSEDDLLSYDPDFAGEGRLFFIFNTSQTITTGQAAAIILGITALLGGLAALAYFFLLSMDSGGGTGTGGGGGYGERLRLSQLITFYIQHT